jgi:hypothetical protein
MKERVDPNWEKPNDETGLLAKAGVTTQAGGQNRFLSARPRLSQEAPQNT